MRLRYAIPALLTALLAAVPATSGARSHRLHKSHGHTGPQVPRGFIGVDFTPPPNVDVGGQFNEMAASGVQSVRLVMDWGAAQPYATFSQIPPSERSAFVSVDGVPTNFTSIDERVGLAAEHGMTVLAQVVNAPSWDTRRRPCVAPPAQDVTSPVVPRAAASAACSWVPVPARDAPYGNFLKALVERYGSRGTFWAQNPQIPRHPVRLWQIWNEPNFLYQWPQPFAGSYVALLRVAHAAVRRADPSGKVVLAGFPNYAWTYLSEIYRRGGRRLFDVVDIHPYTKLLPNVIKFLQLVRARMARAGDRHKPIIVGEFTWPSAIGHHPSQTYFDIETTEGGQARKVGAALPLLAHHRTQLNLIGIYYYTWISQEYPGAPSFAYAGLVAERSNHIVAKPALATFRRSSLNLER
jgi:hypothetical protein